MNGAAAEQAGGDDLADEVQGSEPSATAVETSLEASSVSVTPEQVRIETVAAASVTAVVDLPETEPTPAVAVPVAVPAPALASSPVALPVSEAPAPASEAAPVPSAPIVVPAPVAAPVRAEDLNAAVESAGLQWVQTSRSAVVDETPAMPVERTRRVRKPKAPVVHEPLQQVETGRENTPPA